MAGREIVTGINLVQHGAIRLHVSGIRDLNVRRKVLKQVFGCKSVIVGNANKAGAPVPGVGTPVRFESVIGGRVRRVGSGRR